MCLSISVSSSFNRNTSFFFNYSSITFSSRDFIDISKTRDQIVNLVPFLDLFLSCLPLMETFCRFKTCSFSIDEVFMVRKKSHVEIFTFGKVRAVFDSVFFFNLFSIFCTRNVPWSLITESSACRASSEF